jgi:hypothetical protein
MSLRKIINEATEGSPTSFKEALKEELQERVALKIQEMMESAGRLDETSFEADLKDHEPRMVHGTRGISEKPFKKKFKNQEHMEKWLDSDDGNNCDIHKIERAW